MQGRTERRTVADWAQAWRGAAVVAIASGPSLTDGDLARVQKWRGGGGLRRVIVTNTTFKRALWADAVLGYDYNWWKKYRLEVDRTFNGARLSSAAAPTDWRVTKIGPPHVKLFGNCGTGAIAFSVYAGAARIILLSYDCARNAKGETHHHGDHPKPLSNAFSMPRWPTQFDNVAQFARSHGVDVLNASRETILTCFKRVDLAHTLRAKAVAA